MPAEMDSNLPPTSARSTPSSEPKDVSVQGTPNAPVTGGLSPVARQHPQHAGGSGDDRPGPQSGAGRLVQACQFLPHRVGLKPQRGWRKRNLNFLRTVLLPQMFARRTGAESKPSFPQPGQGDVAVTWIGHATFLLQMGGLNLITDPNWALWHGPVKRARRPGIALRDLPPIDLLLVSHAHFDHLHLPSLPSFAAGQPAVVPAGVGSLLAGRGFSPVVELRPWETFRWKGVEITLTPAQHWGARYLHDTYRGFGGFLIQADGTTVFHAGDSALFPGYAEIGRRADIDMALMPIGAYGAPSGRAVHMNPEEAIEAFDALQGNVMMPMHYATFPLGTEPMDEPLQRLCRGVSGTDWSQRLDVLAEGVPVLYEAGKVMPPRLAAS